MNRYKGYDDLRMPNIANVFATAAFRFGHTLINDEILRLDENGHEIEGPGIEKGNLKLHQAFFAPYRLHNEGGIDPVVRGLFLSKSKSNSNGKINEELIDRFLHMSEEIALDLASLNIQRGRDHALPFYYSWRKLCKLDKNYNEFEKLKDIPAGYHNKLAKLYGNFSNIDPFVGFMLEKKLKNSRVGPTLSCLIRKQFDDIRAGDRLFYARPEIFTGQQLEAIKRISLASVICATSDEIMKVRGDVFEVKSRLVQCKDGVHGIDLTPWKEGCDEGLHTEL